MAEKQLSKNSQTETATVTQVPPDTSPPTTPPISYILTLRRSYEKLKQTLKNMTLEGWLIKIEEERQKVYEESKIENKKLSEVETEFMNKSFKDLLLEKMKEFIDTVFSLLKLQETDTEQTRQMKVVAAQEIISWIKLLNKWFTDEMDKINTSDKPNNEKWDETKKLLEIILKSLNPTHDNEAKKTLETKGEDEYSEESHTKPKMNFMQTNGHLKNLNI